MIKRRARLGKRGLNLVVTWNARPVSGKDDHRKCVAKTIAEVRQQLHAGVCAKCYVQHHGINALGGKRATGTHKGIRRNHICGGTERMSHQREHIVIVVYMENAQTFGLTWSKRGPKDLDKKPEIQWLAEPIQYIEMG